MKKLTTCALALAGILCAQAAEIFVSPTGDDAANDGLSREAPKATIQAAIAALNGPGRVTLLRGTYEQWKEAPASAIILSDAIELVGDEGAENTVIKDMEMVYDTSWTDATEPRRRGIIALTHAGAVVRDVTIEGYSHSNFNDYYGSGRRAVYIGKEGGTLDHVVVRNAKTYNMSAHGAGIHMLGGVVRDSVISNNYCRSSGGAEGRGGGVYMDGGSSETGKLLLERCIITGNVTRDGIGRGGGVYLHKNAKIRNSLIACNRSNKEGSGVYSGDLNNEVESCTIADNYCSESQSAAGLYTKYNIKVRNTIISGNRDTLGERNVTMDGSTYANALTYCCTDVQIDGEGNVAGTPNFVNAAEGDYRIGAGSCVDAGLNQSWMAGVKDLGGKDRIINDRVDIGCYEYEASGIDCSFDAENTVAISQTTARFTASVLGKNLNGLVYEWNFGDGSPLVSGADRAEVEHTYTAPGLYSVSLCVVNADGERADYTAENIIKIAPPTVYVVADGDQARYPYATWETAATNIQDAVDVCVAGCTVMVDDGVYVTDNKILISNVITLKSKNGAERTVITRRGATQEEQTPEQLLDASGDGAIRIDGFTFTGLKAECRAVKLYGESILENCIVSNNTRGCGIYGEQNCKVLNCQVIDNHGYATSGNGHNGVGIFLKYGGTIENCVVVGNSTVDGGWGGGHNGKGGGIAVMDVDSRFTIRNTLVAGNYNAGDCGGVYMEGNVSTLLENCTVVGNSSARNGIHDEQLTGLESGGVYAAYNGCRISNCIITGNSFRNEPKDLSTSPGYKVYGYNNCVGVGSFDYGADNFNADPLFKDAANEDWHLTKASPCVNAGRTLDWHDENARDLDGNVRVYSRAVDLGCYESPYPRGLVMVIR